MSRTDTTWRVTTRGGSVCIEVRDCETCGGSGRVVTVEDDEERTQGPAEDCPVCRGYGTVEEEGEKMKRVPHNQTDCDESCHGCLRCYVNTGDTICGATCEHVDENFPLEDREDCDDEEDEETTK